MAEMNREQETEEILTDAGAAAQDGGDCPEQETETAEKMPEESENAGTEAAEEEGRKGLFTKKKKKDKKKKKKKKKRRTDRRFDRPSQTPDGGI